MQNDFHRSFVRKMYAFCQAQLIVYEKYCINEYVFHKRFYLFSKLYIIMMINYSCCCLCAYIRRESVCNLYKKRWHLLAVVVVKYTRQWLAQIYTTTNNYIKRGNAQQSQLYCLQLFVVVKEKVCSICVQQPHLTLIYKYCRCKKRNVQQANEQMHGDII